MNEAGAIMTDDSFGLDDEGLIGRPSSRERFVTEQTTNKHNCSVYSIYFDESFSAPFGIYSLSFILYDLWWECVVGISSSLFSFLFILHVAVFRLSSCVT